MKLKTKLKTEGDALKAGAKSATSLATDEAELAKLKAELKVTQKAVAAAQKTITDDEKALKAGTGDLSKLNHALQQAYTKAGGALNLISVEVEDNLLGFMSKTETFAAKVVVELYGEKHSFSTNFHLRDIKKNAEAIVEEVKKIVKAHKK